VASHLTGSVVGTFVVGDGTKVGTLGFVAEKPKLTLKGGAFTVRAINDLKVVQVGKAKMTLAAQLVDASGTYVVAFGSPMLTLRAKTFRSVEPTKVSFGTAHLKLKGKSYALIQSTTLAVGKPKLILTGGEIRRVGQVGLIPTAPVPVLLVPTTTDDRDATGILVPTESEAVILTPTPKVYV